MSEKSNSKILIVRLGALGDILHALPAQQLLSEACFHSSVHWLSEAPYVSLLQCVPGLDRVWTADTRKWRAKPGHLGELVHLIRNLRAQNFDLALDFQGLLKSAVLAKWSGAKRIVGYSPERFKEKGIQWFYTDTQDGEANLEHHVIDSNVDLVRRITPVGQVNPVIPYRLPEAAEAYVEERLSELEVERPILLNPGAGWVTKLWPATEYARLALRIREHTGIPVLFTYGPGEEHLIEEIQAVFDPLPVPAFPTSIIELAALCKKARLMVAGDSGPLHLAVSVGTPTVSIIGPTSPSRNGPYNPADSSVRRDLPCSNSYKRRCNEFICMQIPLDTVFNAVIQRLERQEQAVNTGAGVP
jgi:ADP-heptose:LPS heptosyltransferase